MNGCTEEGNIRSDSRLTRLDSLELQRRGPWKTRCRKGLNICTQGDIGGQDKEGGSSCCRQCQRSFRRKQDIDRYKYHNHSGYS